MKPIYLLLILICFSFLNCNSGAICVFSNKNVTVFNDTAHNLTVIARDHSNSRQLGTMKSFEVKVFNVPHSVMLVAGNIYFNTQLFVDPCKQTLELIVED